MKVDWSEISGGEGVRGENKLIKVDFQTEWGNVPLGQPVLVGDICKAINFIIETSAVTGQMIAIDSGQHMG